MLLGIVVTAGLCMLAVAAPRTAHRGIVKLLSNQEWKLAQPGTQPNNQIEQHTESRGARVQYRV